MATQKKLVNKLHRRARSVTEARKDQYKVDKMQEVMQSSPGAYQLMRGPQRRMDASFGYDAVGKEPGLEYIAVASTMDRFDFDAGGGTDFGIRLTLSATGYVAAVAEETDVTTVADVADSLNETYFYFNTPANAYYVWFNTGAGVDPAIAGRTGVEVTITTGDTAAAVATALQAELDALSDVTATVLVDVVSITNDVAGFVVDATDAGATGFTLLVTQQGSNSSRSLIESIGVQVGDTVVIEEDGSELENRYLEVTAIVDATHVRLDDVATFVGPESNVAVRFILSGVKKSYV